MLLCPAGTDLLLVSLHSFIAVGVDRSKPACHCCLHHPTESGFHNKEHPTVEMSASVPRTGTSSAVQSAMSTTLGTKNRARTQKAPHRIQHPTEPGSQQQGFFITREEAVTPLPKSPLSPGAASAPVKIVVTALQWCIRKSDLHCPLIR